MPRLDCSTALMPKLTAPQNRRLVAVVLVLCWIGFCCLQYGVANSRIVACTDELSRAQGDICVRHALEQRDGVLLWGLGVPLVLCIVTSLAVEVRRRSGGVAKDG